MPSKHSIDKGYDNDQQDDENLEIDQDYIVSLGDNEDFESNLTPLSSQDGEARSAWIEHQIERFCSTPPLSDRDYEEEEYVPNFVDELDFQIENEENNDEQQANEELDAQFIFDIVESFQRLNPNIDFHSLDIGQFMLEQGLHPWNSMDQEIIRQFLADLNELDQEQNQ